MAAASDKRYLLLAVSCACGVACGEIACGSLVSPESHSQTEQAANIEQNAKPRAASRAISDWGSSGAQSLDAGADAGSVRPADFGRGAISEPCSDGNQRSHDGCSAAGKSETPCWTQLKTSGDGPTPRHYAVFVYDDNAQHFLLAF